MKNLNLLPLLTTAFMLCSFTIGSKYEAAMKENIEKIYQASTAEELQSVINNFDRIAQMEKDKWEPHYYGAYAYILMTSQTDDGQQKDKYLDQALDRVKKGLTINESEDELIALEGYIHMMRVTIDPMSRGQQYSGLSMQAFNKALAIDPDNPRAMYLMGRMEMGTARFFGSDMTPACEKVKSSIQLFENEKPESVTAPTWGLEQARKVAGYCDQEE